MGWTGEELALALAWRDEDPPLAYGEIALRLGGRSAEAVRQKLISHRVAEARGGARGRLDWMEERIGGPCLGERHFQGVLMGGGGHSRFTEVARRGWPKGHYWALTMPLIGPDGRHRPCTRYDCQCLGAPCARSGLTPGGIYLETFE